MSSEKDPIASVSKGATKGLLEWSEEKLKQFVKKFKDKNIAFIQDSKTIEIAKEQRKKGEWVFFKFYIKDKDLRILFQLGLTLRKLEKENKDVEPLKEKIIKKYKKQGLHIAFFVANGLFGKYIGNILERVPTIDELTGEINKLFQNISHTVAFINREDDIPQKTSEIIIKIQAHSPDTFIISGTGGAVSICDKIKIGVMRKISSNYTCEQHIAEGKKVKEYTS
ncbi:hypothetical protein AYK26_00165 [Euryarchaeota archaeon SM23-78]|nr:MAG: hypothetical protein AYK26_00165 [Euryarchaeota archaeon SM23-78]MBW3000508.1 hypothetical protein [Candidatus Woesearchaeota archaeon]